MPQAPAARPAVRGLRRRVAGAGHRRHRRHLLLFDGIVLRKLPCPSRSPGRRVVRRTGGRFNYSLPYPQFEAIRQRSTTLDGVFATIRSAG